MLKNLEHDSIERIESDLLALTKRWHDYDGNYMKIYSTVAYSQVKELLDRQAKIIERYWMEINGANTLANIELNKQREELQSRINDLKANLATAEGDNEYLRAELAEHVSYEQSKDIVRCRDCVHYEPNTYSHFTCELFTYHAEQDGFCAWGERGIDG